MNVFARLPLASSLACVTLAGAARADGSEVPATLTPLFTLATLACSAGNEAAEEAERAAAAADCDMVGRLPYFAQAAAPWGNRPLGELPLCEGDDAKAQADARDATCCMPYASSGCGPTSLAMVLRAYGERVTPLGVGELAVQAGLRHCNVDGINPAAIIATGRFHGYVLDTSLDAAAEGPPTQGDAAEARLERAQTLLRAGKPLVLGCAGCTVKNASGASRTLGGHFMVLTGMNDDGTFALLDPSGFDARSIDRDEVRLHTRLHYVRRVDGLPVEACRR